MPSASAYFTEAAESFGAAGVYINANTSTTVFALLFTRFLRYMT